MKKLSGGLILVFLFVLLLLRYGMVENPLAEISLPSPFSRNSSQHLQWLSAGVDELVVLNPKNESEIISTGSLMSHLSIPQNLSVEELLSLHTWKHMVYLVNFSKGLPQAVEAVKEAVTAWEGLMASIEDERLARYGNGSKSKRLKEKQCPYSVIRMNSSEFSDGDFRLKIPCGLVQGSSLTVIGNPEGILGNFKIELVGTTLPGEQDPPIILHFNVRLHGDKITENPVIVQNAWTLANDWGPEERCPSPDPDNNNKKVDDLDQCSKVVGEGDEQLFPSKLSSYTSTRNLTKGEGTKPRRYFPFKQGYLAISTLRVGTEGIQTSVNGKHITSFAFREALEPWLVNEARILGDIKLLSVLASGLPTSEDSEHVTDLKLLKSAPLPIHKAVDLFVGVFSTANNFKQRMAVRRTWMQYPAVRSQVVAVRFFVGLHKNQLVNEELWNEARTYGDIQLMPFVDYYSLITLKTVAICIYGTNIVSAKYVMKTDDDAFVRIDEVLSSLNRTNVMHGLLYGRISNDDLPNRNPDSKWYISPEEWPGQRYPPWAHGPGYVVSKDIAKEVYKRHKNGHLKMFKLEDVAMGIWTDDMKKAGMHVEYVNDNRIYIGGCEEGYLVAHYQQPREMLCLWQKLQETNHAKCCGE